MDKNSIIGILLIAAILIVWSVVFGPDKKEMAERKRVQDSLALVLQQEKEQQLKQQQQPITDSSVAETTDTTKKVITEQLGEFAFAAAGEKKLITLENDLIRLSISTLGGRPYSVELKNYKTHKRTPVILFSGDSTEFGLHFYHQHNPISTNNLFFTPGDSLISKNAVSYKNTVSMKLAISENRSIEYIYSLEPGSYMVDFSIRLTGMKDIGTRSPDILDMTWAIYSPQQEQVKKNENQYSSLYYKPLQEKVEYFRMRSKKDLQEVDFPTKLEWIAFKDQFFSSVLIPDESFDNALLKMVNLPEENKFLKHYSAEIGLPFERKENESIDMRIYYGPNKFKLLKKYKELELQNLVTLGNNVIRWINQFVIIPIFDWLSKFIGNYGLIILLLTIIIKIGLLPLTYRSYLSQAKMRVLKPQMDELNKKYPKGKEMEKQQAVMALYKKAGVSPMGGCLPMVLQFPILFAMFRFFPTSIELRQESFLWATDLSTYDAIVSWSAQIPILSNIYGNHISLFTLLMTISTIISMKMGEGATATNQQMPGMKTMMYIMPVMFMFVLNNWSSGLTYYYFLANLITIGQNFLFKQFIDEKEILKKIEARKVKPAKKSNFQKRLEEMAKQKGYKPPKKK
ncbi:MAG: membrane protein insertase YidC [Bacteroidales bacterium]|nr:membrane protein insertase YidC [Bacteroidales bacterium]MBN2762831.1 membrane protein insertase YidC [Bacteroidales bacterium]